jgi:hypothetical protein
MQAPSCQVPLALQVCVSIPQLPPQAAWLVWPGAHTPMQAPPTHVLSTHATALPHDPPAAHVSTPFPEHCVAPGAHTPASPPASTDPESAPDPDSAPVASVAPASPPWSPPLALEQAVQRLTASPSPTTPNPSRIPLITALPPAPTRYGPSFIIGPALRSGQAN